MTSFNQDGLLCLALRCPSPPQGLFHLLFSVSSLSLTLSHSPDIDQGQMIMSKPVTFIFSVSKEHILPLQRLPPRCSNLFSLACLLFTQPLLPTTSFFHTHPQKGTHTQTAYLHSSASCGPSGSRTFNLQFKGLEP